MAHRWPDPRRALPLLALGAFALAGCPAPAPSNPPPPPAASTHLPELPPDPRKLRGEKDPGVVSAVTTQIGSSKLPASPVDGSTLNRFFPRNSTNDKVTFTQEKKGTVLAELTRGGTVIAHLAIVDAAGNPSLRDKFKGATSNIAGFPAASGSSHESAVLVGDRFQVKVRSIDTDFTDIDREATLGRFDLVGLSALK